MMVKIKTWLYSDRDVGYFKLIVDTWYISIVFSKLFYVVYVIYALLTHTGYVPGFETRVLNDLIYYVIFRKEKNNVLSLSIFCRHLKDFLGNRLEIYFVKNIHPAQNFGEQVGSNHNWLLGSEQYFINIWCFNLLFHCRFLIMFRMKYLFAAV